MEAPKVLISKWNVFQKYFQFENISTLKKKVTLPTKFNSVLPGGLVPKLFFCGKIAINQEIVLLLSGVQPHLPCWKELGPEKHFGGEKPDLFIHIFYKEQYCCPPGGGNRAAKTKPGFIWCCGDLSTPVGGMEPAASPLQNIWNRTLGPNPGPCAPKSPPCSSHSPLHR